MNTTDKVASAVVILIDSLHRRCLHHDGRPEQTISTRNSVTDWTATNHLRKTLRDLLFEMDSMKGRPPIVRAAVAAVCATAASLSLSASRCRQHSASRIHTWGASPKIRPVRSVVVTARVKKRKASAGRDSFNSDSPTLYNPAPKSDLEGSNRTECSRSKTQDASSD
jgi:hypothetical protein